MEFAPRLLVVPIVSEDTGLRIESIRPVRVIHAGHQHEQMKSARNLSASPEAALAVHPKKLGKRVIDGVPRPATAIDGIDKKVS